jgi:hypothetical protein
MALDKSTIQNKMVQAPPAKKGFHFASDGLHYAEYIEAATLEEATEFYHNIKKLIFPVAGGTVSAAVEVKEQSTATVVPEPEEKEVQ